MEFSRLMQERIFRVVFNIQVSIVTGQWALSFDSWQGQSLFASAPHLRLALGLSSLLSGACKHYVRVDRTVV